MSELKYSVVIPCHNEGGNIKTLVARLHETLTKTNEAFEIIIVNDNSTDDSWHLLNELKEQYKELAPINRTTLPGVGYAKKEGLLAAKGEIIITMDGDLSHDPYEIPKFLEKLSEFDMICGSRYVNCGRAHMTMSRKIISGTFNVVFRGLIGIPVKDFTSGYRVYKRAIVDSMDLKSKGFGIFIEEPIRAHLKDFKLTEVPVTYHNRHEGISKLNYFKQGPEYVKVALMGLKLRMMKGLGMNV